MTIRFDGRVAVVTGAGNGLGRAYALELARRGAKIAVNDLGGAKEGGGQDSAVAQRVADEIRALGGEAIANGDSVVDAEGMQRLIAQTLEAFGRVDILIANAGIHRAASFDAMSIADFQRMFDVHIMGTLLPIKAAWPHMREQGYGRIVVTTSAAGLFGFADDAHYAAGKMAVVGLMNTLRIEGEPLGIRINAIAPIAATRMGEDAVPPGGWDLYLAQFHPDFVAPGVVFLASTEAPSGTILSAGGGVFSSVQIHCTQGAYLGTDANADTVAAHWSDIVDLSQHHRSDA